MRTFEDNLALMLRNAADTVQREMAELRRQLAEARRDALEGAAQFVHDEWEHEIRVRGLPDAIRALAEKERGG